MPSLAKAYYQDYQTILAVSTTFFTFSKFFFRGSNRPAPQGRQDCRSRRESTRLWTAARRPGVRGSAARFCKENSFVGLENQAESILPIITDLGLDKTAEAVYTLWLSRSVGG